MIQFTVIGTPAPQGSKSFKGIRGGKAVMIESSVKVAPWREAVIWAARGHGKIAGAVDIDLAFTLARPKSSKRGALPAKNPDIDKLCRSTLDALVMAGTIEDDARVLCMVAWKMYVNDRGALDVPGAVIRISSVEAFA